MSATVLVSRAGAAVLMTTCWRMQWKSCDIYYHSTKQPSDTVYRFLRVWVCIWERHQWNFFVKWHRGCWFVYSFTLHRRKPTITSNFMVAWHLYRLWFVCLSHLKTLHSLNLNLFSQLNLLVCSVRERGKWCLLEGTWRCILQETETRQECAQLP